MEVSSSLLVALMFITLITIGIGSVIASLAALVDPKQGLQPDRLHTSWTLLLLLIHLNLFWNTLFLFELEDWGFTQFLYIVAGPILLYFATSMFLPGEAPESGDARDHYFHVAPRFFMLLAAISGWMIGVDLWLGDGFNTASALNSVALLLALFLATTREPRSHWLGTALAWILFLGSVALRGLQII